MFALLNQLRMVVSGLPVNIINILNSTYLLGSHDPAKYEVIIALFPVLFIKFLHQYFNPPIFKQIGAFQYDLLVFLAEENLESHTKYIFFPCQIF